MKKTIKLLILVVALAACVLVTAGCGDTASQAPEAVEPTATVVPTSDALADYSVVGPWGLSSVKNDIAALYDVFGTILRDSGASLEIKSDGECQYYVGAYGGVGTYTRNGALITAQLSSYAENAPETLELTLTEENSQIYLVGIIADTTLWWTQNEDEQMTASPQPSPEEADITAYNEILELYRTALREKYDGIQLSEAGLNFMLVFCNENDGLSEIGYCFLDMDGDNSPELLIAPVSNEDAFYGNIIFDMYTLKDGKPVQILNSGERYRYYLLSDGNLYFEGSNGAAESINQQLTVVNGDVSELVTLSTNYAEEGAPQFTLRYSGSEAEAVSEEEAQSTIQNWQSQITKPEYTPLAQ